MQRNGKGPFLLQIAGVLIAAVGAYLESMIPRQVAGVVPGSGPAIKSLIACCFYMTIEEMFLYEEYEQ